MAKLIHPKKKLSEAVKEAQERNKGQQGVDKRITMVKAPDGVTKSTGDAGDYGSGIQRPTDEQLAKINTFTRSPKTADELVVFSTWSCNDLVDRDYDQFTTATVDEFAALPDPYSPVGKSFMVGHDYSKLPMGRIFDVSATTKDGTRWLKNDVYIPDIEANKSFIENQDFGVYWAVSVGVVLDEAKCKICDADMVWYFCASGHVKGHWYDPDDDPDDPWDWPTPVEEGTKGAEQCIGMFVGARDFYELSQVWLGAQYFAALEDKNPALAGIVKAAGPQPISVGKDLAKEIPIPHAPKQVEEARKKYSTETDGEGNIKWIDDTDLVWVYDPEVDEVLCLGKKATDEEEDDEGTNDQVVEPEHEQHGSGSPGEDDESTDDSGRGDASSGEGDDLPDEEDGESSGSGSGVGDNEGDDEMSDEKVIAAAKRAGIPESLLEKAVESRDPSGSLVDSLFVSLRAQNEAQTTRIKELEPQAQLGESYLKDVTAEAIDWYVKARQTGDKPVSTETFQKVLEACGRNVELIKSLRDEQKEVAKARYPDAVRRSSFPIDPNSADAPTVPSLAQNGDKQSPIQRIHG